MRLRWGELPVFLVTVRPIIRTTVVQAMTLKAAQSAAQIEDLAAVLGRHAGAEAVAAGAHKDARLESTLHSFTPRRARILFDIVLC